MFISYINLFLLLLQLKKRFFLIDSRNMEKAAYKIETFYNLNCKNQLMTIKITIWKPILQIMLTAHIV